MAWNLKTKIVAVGIAIQPTPGLFNPPGQADLIGISVPNNADEIVQAADPTMTGGIWEQPRIYLGRSSTVGATMPLRGPGGGALPAANAYVPGRVLQSAGFAELRIAAAIAQNTGVGGHTTQAIKLHGGASAVDDFYLGAPIQHANIGTGFQGYSLITDYNGTTKVATIGETIVAVGDGTAFVIPECLVYQLGALSDAPPLLSVSVWRNGVRYDYRDCRISSIGFDIPVSNEANQSFPSCEFTLRGVKVGKFDEATPLVPASVLNVPVPAARGGKFIMDRVKLGHANLRAGINADTGAASNQNQTAGQDGYEILSAARTVETDLNEMNVSTFDIEARIDDGNGNQTILPIIDTWGGAVRNRFGFTLPGVVLDPHNPGDRNGFVNLSGNAHPVDVDKSMALAIW